MAHNLSWIDPEALRSLVAQTAYQSVTPQAAAQAPLLRPEPLTRAPIAPQGPAPGRLRASVRRASRPSLPDPDATPTSRARPPHAQPSLSLEARLEALMDWACRSTGLSRAFVADAQGLLVASLGFGANAVDAAAATVELCTLQLPPDIRRADAGTVTMTAPERTQVVAWQRTRHGRTYLALHGIDAPMPEGTARLCSAILDAVG